MSNTDPDISAIKQAGLARRRGIKPKSISGSLPDLVSFGYLQADRTLPLVVKPHLKGISLPGWIRSNAEFVEQALLKDGGVLFRGFSMHAQKDLEQFVDAISLESMSYIEGATPRTELGNKVYTSTEFPPDQSIALHNELTYVTSWPTKIIFFCVTPAEQGGETPIADVRRVYKRIPPDIVSRFMEKGWMLQRNYGRGLSLPWQTTFRTKDRAEVEHYCRSANIEFEWKSENWLRTRQVRSPIAIHPKTGETVWFNHVAFWHVSSLDSVVREVMLRQLGESDLPYNTFYGDGTPIEDAVVEELRQAYRQETTSFPWLPGDILLLDNMLVAHARNPYKGARKILVAMGDPFSLTVRTVV
jgi:alpha-ketoglutarate-dependent taurine dioxygenase